ncbi:MAG: ThiF family adenylyltransferase [Thermoplasmata archaeon]|nr:ThiF family adenylyltransferase [Thermoplasmata archaeon]
MAKEKIESMNSEIDVEAIDGAIKKENALELLKNVDVILDCTDNFSRRYLLNETAVKMAMPLFFAPCREMQGMITTVIPEKTTCIQCIFPMPLEKEKEMPILGAVVGTMRAMQATEVIK